MNTPKRWTALLAVCAAVLVGLLCGQVQAQTTVATEPPKDEAPKELKSLRVVHADPEFVGTVKEKDPVVRRVAFFNTTKSPVTLEVISKSCSCLTTEFTRPTVQPGETTTLTIVATSIPSTDSWAFQVTFKATWDEEGQRSEERGQVLMRYRCDVLFSVMPELAAATKVVGDEGWIDLSIVGESETDQLPAFDTPIITVEGWKVESIGPVEGAPNVFAFRAHGPISKIGRSTGEIRWMAKGADSQPMKRTPLILTGIWPLRSMPGGAVFVPHGADESMTKAVKLIERAGVKAKAWSVSLVEESEWVTTTLDAEGVKVTLRAGEKRPDFGSARARVLDADGKAIFEFPIAWWTTPTSPPR